MPLLHSRVGGINSTTAPETGQQEPGPGPCTGQGGIMRRHTPGKWYASTTGDQSFLVAAVYDKRNAALIAAAPELLDFAIQVKYSLGGGCDPGKDAAPYTNEELIDMASRLIEAAEGVRDAETD